MAVWDAEVVVGPELARRLIRKLMPDQPGDSLQLFAEGFDNRVYESDGWLFRFPRREMAVPGVVREARVLPTLSLYLPLPIPVPTAVGAPSDDFPWMYFAYRQIPGVELARLLQARGTHTQTCLEGSLTARPPPPARPSAIRPTTRASLSFEPNPLRSVPHPAQGRPNRR